MLFRSTGLCLFDSSVGNENTAFDVSLRDGEHHGADLQGSQGIGCDAGGGGAGVELRGHTAAVTSLAFDRTGTRLVSGSADGSARAVAAERVVRSGVTFDDAKFSSYFPPCYAGQTAAQGCTLPGPTFDAAGLYLTGVGYDAKWQLPQRARYASARPIASTDFSESSNPLRLAASRCFETRSARSIISGIP